MQNKVNLFIKEFVTLERIKINSKKSYLEVNLSAIKNNIKKIKNVVGENVTIAPVIKANAYGLDTKGLKDIFEKENIRIVIVATIEEAIKLRNEGYRQEIITLNELLPCEVENIIKYNISPGISDYNVIYVLNEIAKKEKRIVNIHVEVDTGMGRVGKQPEEMIDFILKITELSNINIEGIYTHFSSADSSKEYTEIQILKFNKVIEELERKGIKLKYIHSSASSGILNFPEAKFNMVRPGIITYGYMPDKNMKNNIGLKPTTKMISHVVFAKEVEKGTAIGYSRTYIAPEKRKIATVPLGYADGIRRALSNKGRVYIKGKYAPIVGNVCMDNFMIDVTGIDVNVGDEVIIWDNQNITIEEIADICGTINYEILCGISMRVKRVYKKE